MLAGEHQISGLTSRRLQRLLLKWTRSQIGRGLHGEPPSGLEFVTSIETLRASLRSRTVRVNPQVCTRRLAGEG
jgi:hypothetical protein